MIPREGEPLRTFPRNAGRLFPVGRLDYDAEGLLLLTNDGMLAHRLMHPNHKVWKSYFVKVKGMVSEQVLRTMRKRPKNQREKTPASSGQITPHGE